MLWILLLLPWLLGANWYVDNTVGSSGAGTSWASAWKNFSNIVWASISPGDTLHISGGTYNEVLTVGKSGASGAPITVTRSTESGHTNTVIIDGQLTRDNGVVLDGFNYITVRGLAVRNHIGEYGQIKAFNGTGLLIDSNDLYVTGHAGVFMQNCTNCTIRRNYISTPVSSINQTDGIYSQLNTGSNTYENNTIVITNEDTGGHNDCIQAQFDTGTVIRNNYCEQANTKTTNAQGIWLTENTGTWNIYNNVIVAPNSKGAFIGGRNTPTGSAVYNISNNSIWGNGSFGFIWVSFSATSEVKNNILYTTDTTFPSLIRWEGTMPAAANIDYNLYYALNGWTDLWWAETANIKYTWSSWQALGYDAHGKNTDPQFRSSAEKNLNLQATSQAINTGLTIAAVTTDIRGTARPQGGVYDMGAYEYTTPAFLTDNAIHTPPDCGVYAYETFTPASASFPVVGATYLDPIFGETITRLTNVYPSTSGGSAIIYSPNGLWNANSTGYLHQRLGGAIDVINPATGATIRASVPYTVTATTDAVSFDPVDPDIYYYTNGTTLSKYSIASGTSSSVKTFAGTLGSVGQTGDWIDKTGRYFLLQIGGNFRVWDKQTDTLYTGSIPVPGTIGGDDSIPKGWAAISPDAAFVVLNYGLSPFKHYSYTINHGTTTLSTTAVSFWDAGGDHGDIMTASDGNTYLVTMNHSYGAQALRGVYRAKVTNDATASPFAAQLAMPGNVQLVPLPTPAANLGLAHFSCPAYGTYADWCYVSIEDGTDLLGSPGTWSPYKQEILMVHIVPPYEVRRLLHHRSRPIHTSTGGFCRTPRVNSNWQGTKFMFTSPFSAPDSSDCGYSDLYRWDAP